MVSNFSFVWCSFILSYSSIHILMFFCCFRYFLHGSCSKGQSCIYAHDLNAKPDNVRLLFCIILFLPFTREEMIIRQLKFVHNYFVVHFLNNITESLLLLLWIYFINKKLMMLAKVSEGITLRHITFLFDVVEMQVLLSWIMFLW